MKKNFLNLLLCFLLVFSGVLFIKSANFQASAQVIGGGGEEQCGEPEFPPCQGGNPGVGNPGGGTEIPPTPPSGGATTPTPTPTPIVPVPTCADPNGCPNTTPTPTQIPVSDCGGICTIGASDQCPTDLSCQCPINSSCPEGNGICLNSTCSQIDQNLSTCKCDGCLPCDSLFCADQDPNPGRVIVVPIITPGEGPEANPACYNCVAYYINGERHDCNEILTPAPVEFKRANGAACKNYNITMETTGGVSCGCSSQVCCADCEPPKIVPGYENGCALCDFQTTIGGNPVMCPANNQSCPGDDVAVELTNPSGGDYCVDFGNGIIKCGNPGDPPVDEFGDSGFYDLTVSCTPPGYDHPVTCKKEISVTCDCPDDNPTPTPVGGGTPTPTIGPWFKLKDASYARQTDLVNLIPDPATSFDGGAEDLVCHDTRMTDYRCMLSREAGVEIVAGTINLNGAPVSHRGWKQENGNVTLDMSPTEFLEYVKAKKQYETITKSDLDNFIPDVTLTSDKVYILDDPNNPTITLNNLSFVGQTLPFVLIIKADVVVNNNITALESVSGAIISTGELKISSSVSELNGIFFTNTLDWTADTPQYPNPIKIVGNMISYNSTDTMNKRVNSPVSKPGIFVVFDIARHIDLWPLLTIKNTNVQEEIQ